MKNSLATRQMPTIVFGAPDILQDTHDWNPNDVAEETSDAYSAKAYADWTGVARSLKKRGYSKNQATAIMRSKWVRWAIDTFHSGNGLAQSLIVGKYLDRYKYYADSAEVKQLTEATMETIKNAHLDYIPSLFSEAAKGYVGRTDTVIHQNVNEFKDTAYFIVRHDNAPKSPTYSLIRAFKLSGGITAHASVDLRNVTPEAVMAKLLEKIK